MFHDHLLLKYYYILAMAICYSIAAVRVAAAADVVVVYHYYYCNACLCASRNISVSSHPPLGSQLYTSFSFLPQILCA